MFEIAAGSVVGRDHVGPGKNNQDAFYFISSGPIKVAIVCDGCGSSMHSEVGAKLGARLIAEGLYRHLKQIGTASEFAPVSAEKVIPRALEHVRLDVVSHLRLLANAMGGDFRGAVVDYFLFTVVGAVVTPSIAFTFSLGDGVIIFNGEKIDISPRNEMNAPSYLAYELVKDTLKVPEMELRFRFHPMIDADEFSNLLIGTDGVEALIANKGRRLPGKVEAIGPVSDLWTEDRFFKNPDALRRFLVLVNREHVRHDWEEQVAHREFGCLKDDTTIVVIRREPYESES